MINFTPNGSNFSYQIETKAQSKNILPEVEIPSNYSILRLSDQQKIIEMRFLSIDTVEEKAIEITPSSSAEFDNEFIQELEIKFLGIRGYYIYAYGINDSTIELTIPDTGIQVQNGSIYSSEEERKLKKDYPSRDNFQQWDTGFYTQTCELRYGEYPNIGTLTITSPLNDFNKNLLKIDYLNYYGEGFHREGGLLGEIKKYLCLALREAIDYENNPINTPRFTKAPLNKEDVNIIISLDTIDLDLFFEVKSNFNDRMVFTIEEAYANPEAPQYFYIPNKFLNVEVHTLRHFSVAFIKDIPVNSKPPEIIEFLTEGDHDIKSQFLMIKALPSLYPKIPLNLTNSSILEAVHYLKSLDNEPTEENIAQAMQMIVSNFHELADLSDLPELRISWHHELIGIKSFNSPSNFTRAGLLAQNLL